MVIRQRDITGITKNPKRKSQEGLRDKEWIQRERERREIQDDYFQLSTDQIAREELASYLVGKVLDTDVLPEVRYTINSLKRPSIFSIELNGFSFERDIRVKCIQMNARVTVAGYECRSAARIPYECMPTGPNFKKFLGEVREDFDNNSGRRVFKHLEEKAKEKLPNIIMNFLVEELFYGPENQRNYQGSVANRSLAKADN